MTIVLTTILILIPHVTRKPGRGIPLSVQKLLAVRKLTRSGIGLSKFLLGSGTFQQQWGALHSTMAVRAPVSSKGEYCTYIMDQFS